MRTSYRQLIYMWMVALLFLTMLPSGIHVEASDDAVSDVEEGDIKQHDLFEFEAFIKHSNIADGTEGFDTNDEPGNDSSEHNGIVRTWDTITYPIKMTVNPKKADMLENIQIKISGTLENGIGDDRVNAKFAVGGYEDMDKKEVGFEQIYTIERTGNSVMVPVAIEVQGAKHGVELRPDIKVQIMSIDGESIESDNAITHFDSLPSVSVSAKVNIKPMLAHGLGGLGYPYYPYSKMYSGGSDYSGIHAFALSWSVDRLPGKSDMRGATMPDADGEINYTIELYGDVYWDNKPKKSGTEAFDFDGRDTPFLLFDHQPINAVKNKIGSKHTIADGRAYTHGYPRHYVAANSSMPNFDKKTIEKHSYNSVWDSGEWEISQPKQERRKVVYKGTNTGYKIGSTFPMRHAYVNDDPRYKVYGVNDKVFSTNGFIIDMQNEYRVGAKNNPNNYTNNVYYRAKVILDNYTDENGNVTAFNKSTTTSFTLRNGTGGMAAYGTFQLYPSGYTSPKNPWNYSASVGDASILIGQDVNFTPRLNPSDNLYGGYKAAYRWNTDAFELTKSYAQSAERNIYARGYRNLVYDWVKNDYENQKVYYGVAKFSDNSFENFTSKGIDDYTWYKTYDEAVRRGPIGAMLSDVLAPVGGMKGSALNIPLHVKHENIGFGSETKDGTPLIALINADAYLDENRERVIDVTGNRSYNNYSKWDEAGNLLQIQSPVGGSVNFESLAVVPAKTSTSITSDKATYYNSETIRWTAKSDIVFPEYGLPSDIDTGVTVKQTLPKGLDYKTGSGKVGNVPTDPEVIENSNGTKTLVWSLLVSNSTHTIDTITFDTTINPFALSSGVQSSITVNNVIESDLDGGPEASRSSSRTVTILKVGMVGIYETIDSTHGDKNSDYTVTLSPYTTIEDELDVTGLTHIPLSGDDIGSNYSGSVKLKELNVQADRVHEDEDVVVYLNKNPIYSDRPHEIDVTTDGWYEYTGEASQLEDAVSIWFRVEGEMTNKDDIQIDLTMQTSNNEFGDIYMNETIVNSATDYRLSPVSNRVRYTIRADLELALERFKIYTNKASEGLPTSVRVGQVVLDEESVKDEPITLAIYETESGDKVTEKTYKQSELSRENEIKIPAAVLEQDDVKNYEVRIENFNTDKIWVKAGEGAIDTDGHTSKESTLTEEDMNGAGDIKFKGVVMTERELGREMSVYHESFTIPEITNPDVKSGYGFEMNGEVAYTNELLTDIQSRIGVPFSVGAVLEADNHLLDKSLEYYDSEQATSRIGMESTNNPSDGVITTAYALPKMFLEQDTGLTYTANQKENGEIEGEALEAGKKLYVPVWISEPGAYDVSLKSSEPLGVHRMNFDILRHVNVDAYMFHHTDSETPDKDELLIHPMEQSDIPENW